MYDPREDIYGIGPDEGQLDGADGISLAAQLGNPLLSPFMSDTVKEENDLYFPVYEHDDKVRDDGSSECVESAGLSPSPSLIVRPISHVSIERPEDDLAARMLPVRHVDYLSHDWSEADLWATWKHIVSERSAYDNSVRLENASWRSWEKIRSNLKTISPGSVKWMKDHDVTWLYGPLQPGSGLGAPRRLDDTFRRRHHSLGSPNQKPILKKRSLSELMLRKSVSSASLLRQAASAAEAFSKRNASFSTYNSYLLGSNPALTPPASYVSEVGTPNPNSWKNVRFYELVEQCVAVSNTDDDLNGSLDTDDDVVVMKRISKHIRKQSPSGAALPDFPPSKTIEKLPQAPLKSPEPLRYDELGISYFPIQRVISPPIESLPVSVEDDSEVEDDDWNPPKWFRSRKDSVHLLHDKLDAIKRSVGISPTSKSSSVSPLGETPLMKDHTVGESALVMESKKSPITFKLTSFSFTNTNASDMSTPALSTSSSDTPKSARSEAIDPAYTSADYFSPRSSDASTHDDEYDWIEAYPPDNAMGTSRGPLLHTRSLTPSSAFSTQPISVDNALLSDREPVARTSSDSGYGPELPGILRDALVDHASVRDTYNGTPEIEKEKAVCDWDLYPGAWDAMELEEAVAWSEGF